MTIRFYSIDAAPRTLPICELILDDLGRPPAPRFARTLGVGASTVYRWNQAGSARRMACLALPGLADIKSYLMDTLETSLELLEKAPDDDDALYFFRLALFHEDMHGEALIYMAQTLGLPLSLSVPGPLAVREPLLVPATRWQLGTAGGSGFSFDNERQAHEVHVPEFEIDAQVVTWAQFVEFVDDGGYDRPELWQPQGWEWLQKEGRRAPRYVDQIGVASRVSACNCRVCCACTTV